MPECEDLLAQEHERTDDGDADQKENEPVLSVRLSSLRDVAGQE